MTTYRLNTKVILDNTGTEIWLPTLFSSSNRPIIPIVKYLIDKADRSNSWQIKTIHSFKLLIEYSEAHWGTFASPQEMFRTFSRRVFEGTIGLNGDDPSGLRWKPRRAENANQILNCITQFSDWLYENSNQEIELLNPWRQANSHEKRLFWAAYHHKKNNCFLGHLFTGKRTAIFSRTHRTRLPPPIDIDRPKSFPEDKLYKLITEGFINRGINSCHLLDNMNIRAVLITLLMHWGGLRLSECFHIWVCDILPHPKDASIALIRVYHPEIGAAPDHADMCRDTYLKNIGMLPRNKYPSNHALRAGWKGSTLENRKGSYFNVYWADEHAKIFMKLWRFYRDHQRIHPTKSKMPLHPFAFTNRNGSPYSYKKYMVAHKTAVERIGLVHRKENGTTPHGHRHATGKRLIDSNMPKEIIRKVLHHRSLFSQEVYTSPSPTDISEAMNKAFNDTIELNI